MLKGNKGEWSEIYVFLYLLSNGVLKAADSNLNSTDARISVLRIPREEAGGTSLNYVPSGNDSDKARIYDGDKLLKTVSKRELDEILDKLREKIPAGARSFEIPEVNDFFRSLFIGEIKADSAHKRDIDIQVCDTRTGATALRGFSIKSYLGAKPTLINAGKNTNIVYEVKGCTESIAGRVNRIATESKIMDRVNELLNSGCAFAFDKTASARFGENLKFIDTQMPVLLAHALLISYTDNIGDLSRVTEKLKSENPLNFTNVGIYEYKLKKFLCAAALGMTPDKIWEGEEEANGGYIVVKHDGSVVCYHIYDRNEFERYLFESTRFERASTVRHGYASVYVENDCFKINLNLQIRFR